MAQIGNRLNSALNGEWATHVRWWGKRFTAGIRRMQGKEIIINDLNPKDDDSDKAHDIFCQMYDTNDYQTGHMYERGDIHALEFVSQDKPHLYPLSELCIKKAA